MCGIAGFSLLHQDRLKDLESFATRMGSAIAHRGPDASGLWSDPRLGLALAHQRLAVLDLTAAGFQPMHSASGRYVIAFNGEIYNHLSLRSELDSAGLSPIWRGHSDTETLLAAIEAWGLESALQRCTGMWALALIDRKEHRLNLARDRFGEKPLYWGFTGSGQLRALVFASELAAFREYPSFNNTIDRKAFFELLRFGHIPAPLSIYAGIAKLPPGHLATISLPLVSQSQFTASRPWWRLHDVIANGYAHPLGSDEEGIDLLHSTLAKAVGDQALSDVPLGSFLSGGVDSSLVTSLLQSQRSSPLRTFTIGFAESSFNEAQHARAVAAHLGTDHTEIMLTSSDARALIPHLPQLYSEPFADSSQLPTHLVCREARRAGLTVALTGDGGDENFGGYNRYIWGPRLWNRLSLLPGPIRRKLGRSISRIHPSFWDFISHSVPVDQLGHKASKLSAVLNSSNSSYDLYRSLVCAFEDPSSLLQGDTLFDRTLPTSTDHALTSCLKSDPVAWMMASDALGYLPDDILVKVDRASMAVGLETRAPLLDHRVAAVAWQLPMNMKIRSGTSKWALRQILYEYIPRQLIERPKKGFAIPIGQWLRGPLQAWADDLLHPDRLQREGYFRPEPIIELWEQHLSGGCDHTAKLWTVLMWQAWLEQWG